MYLSLYSTGINYWGNLDMMGVICVYHRNPEARKASVQFTNGKTEQQLFFLQEYSISYQNMAFN